MVEDERKEPYKNIYYNTSALLQVFKINFVLLCCYFCNIDDINLEIR